jgi:hypothetical protein
MSAKHPQASQLFTPAPTSSSVSSQAAQPWTYVDCLTPILQTFYYLEDLLAAILTGCVGAGCGRSAVAGQSLAKVTLENCEINMTAATETAVRQILLIFLQLQYE